MITSLLIIFNLIILESLLSIDNAAVLAVMVKHLPPKQQAKALKYGILGAFVFRGLCLFIASWLIKIVWLKIIGGLYLLYLVYNYYKQKAEKEEAEANNTKLPRADKLSKHINLFWSTVILVEVMDIAFSIDNIFAAVAMTNNIYLIITGVCIGIVSMRFVAQGFTVLMQKYESLEQSAYIVISLLGLKLVVSGILDYTNYILLKFILNSHWFDLGFSGIMILIFLTPIFSKKLKFART